MTTIGVDPRQSWDSVQNWWVRPLYDALYPEAEKRQQPDIPQNCPRFGKESVLMRPIDLTVDEKDTICPGLHTFQETGSTKNSYAVTWWDPRALSLGVPQPFGTRQEELLKESKDLWEASLARLSQIESLPFGHDATELAGLRSGPGLAYVQGSSNVNIWRLDLLASPPQARKLVASTRDQSGQASRRTGA